MPGFLGCCSGNLSVDIADVRKGIAYTVYSAKTSSEVLLQHHQLLLAKSQFKFLRDEKSCEGKSAIVWVDGEVFNLIDISGSDASFAALVLKAYEDKSLDSLLSIVDGIFVAVIFDKQTSSLHLVTDRYGLKPLYYYHKNNHLFFTSEVKCFTAFKQFSLELNTQAIDLFLKLEHFLGNLTWFNNVFVAEPSSVMTYDLQQDKISSRKYWSWSAIKASTGISVEEASDQLAALFNDACERRSNDTQRFGISLSGGLDSRAILASVKKIKPYAFTFGISGSEDVRVARKVAHVAGVEHEVYDLYTKNWLEERFSGVWKTDGMLNMYHMHYSHLMPALSAKVDVNLSGFLGDAVVGGSYLRKKGKTFLDKRVSKEIASHYYGTYSEISDPRDSYFDIQKPDPYLFYNRGRRMIGMGLEEPEKTMHQRLPFMDIKLMDFAYSLPDSYRLDSKVYNMALLKAFPEFFSDIPRAATRVPIANRPSLKHKAIKEYHRLLDMAKYKLNIPTAYTDVNNWIKVKSTAAFIISLLDPKTALYSNYTRRNFVEEYVLPHLNGKGNFRKEIMGALTLEIWLQQILNNKWRSAPVKESDRS